MSIRVEVTRDDSPLARRVWQFDLFIDNTGRDALYCQYYYEQEKQTARHKWKSPSHWNRYDHRTNNIELTVPDDVLIEARKNIANQIYLLPLKP